MADRFIFPVLGVLSFISLNETTTEETIINNVKGDSNAQHVIIELHKKAGFIAIKKDEKIYITSRGKNEMRNIEVRFGRSTETFNFLMRFFIEINPGHTVEELFHMTNFKKKKIIGALVVLKQKKDIMVQGVSKQYRYYPNPDNLIMSHIERNILEVEKATEEVIETASNTIKNREEAMRSIQTLIANNKSTTPILENLAKIITNNMKVNSILLEENTRLKRENAEMKRDLEKIMRIKAIMKDLSE